MKTRRAWLLLSLLGCASPAPAPFSAPDGRDCTGAGASCLDVVFLVDVSASAGEVSGTRRLNPTPPDWRHAEPDSLLAAALQSLERSLPALDHERVATGLVAFAGRSGFLSACEVQRDAWVETPLTTDRSAVVAGLERIANRGACGRTYAPAGIELALELFSATPSRKTIVAILEGVPNQPGNPRSDDPPSERAALRRTGIELRALADGARQRNVSIDWLSFDLDDAEIESLLREVSEATGGRFVKVAALDQLEAALASLMQAKLTAPAP